MTGDIGSPNYSSPEQLSSNEYSIKTDIYSIGKIINFIITEKQLLKAINKNDSNLKYIFQ